MTNDEPLLTVTSLLSIATELLEESGYKRVEDDKLLTLALRGGRLFEDEFGIVAIVVFETWDELSEEWPEAQAALVQVISDYVAASDPKSWEGYLVLLTPGVHTGRAAKEIDGIRHNTSRVRKLVATGEELSTPSDVKRTLLPVLPLTNDQVAEPFGSVLDLLPKLLARQAVPEATGRALVDAFENQQSLIEGVHATRETNEDS